MSAQVAESNLHLTACHSCDALLRLTVIQHMTYRCPRCSAMVFRAGYAKRIDDALAFELAALLFFVLANTFPVVAIASGGDKSEATLPGAAVALSQQGMTLVACMIALTTFLIPAAELGCMLAMLWFTKIKRTIPFAFLYRLRKTIRPWSMIEIFVLGTLVAIVKLGSWADVVVGVGLWSLGTFIVLHAAASHAFEAIDFWDKVETAS